MLRAGPLSGFQSLARNSAHTCHFEQRREIFLDCVEFEIRKISPFDRNDRG